MATTAPRWSPGFGESLEHERLGDSSDSDPDGDDSVSVAPSQDDLDTSSVRGADDASIAASPINASSRSAAGSDGDATSAPAQRKSAAHSSKRPRRREDAVIQSLSDLVGVLREGMQQQHERAQAQNALLLALARSLAPPPPSTPRETTDRQ